MATDSAFPALPDAGVRFGLRNILAATVLAAAGAAGAGSVYRSAERSAQGSLLAFWGATAMTAAVLALVRWALNYRLAQASGPTRFRLRRCDSAGLHFNLVSFLPYSLWGLAMIAVVAGLIWIAGTAIVASTSRGEPAPVSIAALSGLALSFVFTTSVLAISSRYRWRQVWLCDHGVVIDGQVRSWASVRGCQWLQFQPDLMIISTMAGHYAVQIPAMRRAVIGDFIRSRTQLDEGLL